MIAPKGRGSQETTTLAIPMMDSEPPKGPCPSTNRLVEVLLNHTTRLVHTNINEGCNGSVVFASPARITVAGAVAYSLHERW